MRMVMRCSARTPLPGPPGMARVSWPISGGAKSPSHSKLGIAFRGSVVIRLELSCGGSAAEPPAFMMEVTFDDIARSTGVEQPGQVGPVA